MKNIRTPFFKIFILLIFFISSCQKTYHCTCTSIINNNEVIIESVRTTKLGSKGYQETCEKYETTDLVDCYVK